MKRVRIVTLTGEVKRVPRGHIPVVELNLHADSRIIDFKLKARDLWDTDRVTVDWSWTALVESRV